MKKLLAFLILTLYAATATKAEKPKVIEDSNMVFFSGYDHNLITLYNDINGNNDIISFIRLYCSTDNRDRFVVSLNSSDFHDLDSQKDVPVTITFTPDFGKTDIVVKGKADTYQTEIMLLPFLFDYNSRDKDFKNKSEKETSSEMLSLLTLYPIKSISLKGRTYNFTPRYILGQADKTTNNLMSIQQALIAQKYNLPLLSESFSYSLYPDQRKLSKSRLQTGTFTNSRGSVEWKACNYGANGDPLSNGSRVSLDEAKKHCPAGWRLPTLRDYLELFYSNNVSYTVIDGKKVAVVCDGGVTMAIPYYDYGGMLWTADYYPEWKMQGAANFVDQTGARWDIFTCDAAPADGANIFVRYVRDKK